MKTNAILISGFGINCEHETAHSIRKAGGEADIIHLNKLMDGPALLQTYNLLVVPGGFSYADHLGAAKVLSNKIYYKLKEQLNIFINDGKLILGICNGFQVLAKMGILPYANFEQSFTLTSNDSGKFEGRWVRLKINNNSPCIFTKDIDYLDLPVRHGEGKFIPKNQEVLFDILNNNLYPVQYVNGRGKLAGYPFNPNGSLQNIAGICDKSGRIFGLMPHPEAFNHYTNYPYWNGRKPDNGKGLKIFSNAVKYIEENL